MNRAGTMVPNLFGKETSFSLRPALFPPVPGIALNGNQARKLDFAQKRLAELVAFVRDSPETQYFIPMIQLREAILSSRIEDIECSMDEVLKAEAGKMRGREVCLVQGLREAAKYALSRRKKLPLCNRLVREAHRVLFGTVCETGKNPGEFSKTQNWIGPAGCTLATASHVPPPNVQDMLEGLANLENYINYRDGSDPLIRAALVHYQFETIKAAHHIVPS